MSKWDEWVHAFWHGRIIAVQLLIVQFALILALLVYVRESIYFYPAVISLIASYGVFTDCAAHLWPLYNVNLVTSRQWLKKLLRGRTHDVYGMLIVIASDLTITGMNVRLYNALILFIVLISLIETGAFAYTRFFH